MAAKRAAKRAAKHIPAGEFKAKCLGLIEEVRRKRKEFVVTRRGVPVARLVPVEEEKPQIFGRMKGMIEILGDIVGPTGERWEADE